MLKWGRLQLQHHSEPEGRPLVFRRGGGREFLFL
jgi:hypothetical protein